MRQGARHPLVVAIDEGTTGVRALVLDASGTPRAEAYREVLPAGAVQALGIATQRATAIVWEAATSRAVAPALSWQDGRTAGRCERLLEEGLFVSPLSAATKIEWILDRVDREREALRAGRLR